MVNMSCLPVALSPIRLVSLKVTIATVRYWHFIVTAFDEESKSEQSLERVRVHGDNRRNRHAETI